jgi:hypothetical protein
MGARMALGLTGCAKRSHRVQLFDSKETVSEYPDGNK